MKQEKKYSLKGFALSLSVSVAKRVNESQSHIKQLKRFRGRTHRLKSLLDTGTGADILRHVNMKNKNILTLLVMLFIGLTGCTEITENPWDNDVVNHLTDKEWVREYHLFLPDNREVDTREICIFKKDASGSLKAINTYNDGEIEEFITYFKWTFTTPHFDIIYMDDSRYWQIEKLTSEKLCVHQTYDDPVRYPEENRTYKEYTANKQEGVSK